MAGYDIVIIGGGLGGLECGAILSKEGFNVLLLEQNAHLGGALQTFGYKGYKLDTGMHYMGALDEGELLSSCFNYISVLDKISLERLDSNAMDLLYTPSSSYALPMGREEYQERLIGYFPSQKDGIKRYMALSEEVGRSISLDNLKRGKITEGGKEFIGKPAYGVISSCIENQELRALLASNNLLYAGVRERSSFYIHGVINESFHKGAYRILGGSSTLADALASVIQTNGGTVRRGCRVRRIKVYNGRASGVELESGEFIESKYLISDIHPSATLEMVDECSQIKKIYRKRLSSLDNSYGFFTAYLLFAPERVMYLNSNIYLQLTEDVWFCGSGQSGRFPHSCFISMGGAQRKGQEFAPYLSVMAPMSYSDLAAWENTRVGRRGEEYLRFKEGKVRAIIDAISQTPVAELFPLSGDALAATFSTTPLSYRDFTSTPNGSAYGVIKDYNAPEVTLISPKSRLDGLLFTGQNVNFHGGVGVTITALLTCAELLGEEYLSKRIANG